MKTLRMLLVLVVILLLTGALAWKFSAKDDAQPTTKSAMMPLASALTKPIASSPTVAVVAPKAAPVIGKDKPKEFTPEDRKWVEDDLKSTTEVMPIIKKQSEERIASATNDVIRARLVQLEQNELDGLQKRADLLRHAKPPEDFGDIVVAGLPQDTGKLEAPTAPRYTLSGGESFTVARHYTGWWSLLISEDVPGATGPYGGKYYYQITFGRPIILMMQDGALAKFTLTGNMPDAPTSSNNPRMGFSGQAAGMGRNPATTGSN